MSKMGRVAISIVLYLIHGFKAAHLQRLVSARAAVRLARLFQTLTPVNSRKNRKRRGSPGRVTASDPSATTSTVVKFGHGAAGLPIFSVPEGIGGFFRSYDDGTAEKSVFVDMTSPPLAHNPFGKLR
jgi:hypothetical protein